MNENIVKTDWNGKEIWLVKTAHVSKNSLEDAQNTLNEVKPDAVCIELDEERYDSMTASDRWENTDITQIIKENKTGLLLVNTILASFQKRMADKLDTNAGGEMKAGIEYAKDNNIPLVLADRNVKNTFSRIWNSLSLFEKAKLLTAIIFSIFDNEEISEEDLEALKEADALEAALAEVGKTFPKVKEILVDERDAYLSYKIKNAPGNRIVAIIGAAHCNGILNDFKNDYDLKELEKVPPKSKTTSYLKWLLPILLILIVGYTLFINYDLALKQLSSWLIWNSSLAALAALLCGAHIQTIIISFLMAPLTSLSPILAVGWFAGLSEAKIDSPKVKDFENIAYDITTFKGFRHNKVMKILMVVIMTNLFSTIGTFISGIDILATFIGIFK